MISQSQRTGAATLARSIYIIKHISAQIKRVGRVFCFCFRPQKKRYTDTAADTEEYKRYADRAAWRLSAPFAYRSH